MPLIDVLIDKFQLFVFFKFLITFNVMQDDDDSEQQGSQEKKFADQFVGISIKVFPSQSSFCFPLVPLAKI